MNLFEQLILGADAEAAEIEKLKKGSANASKIQEIIDKIPEGKDKQKAQKSLDSTIKDLSAREQKTAPQAPADQAPAQAQQAPAQAQQAPAQAQQAPAAQAQAPAAQPQAQSEPSDEEKQMLQKLHNSPYDPKSKSDKRNLDILRQARQQVGKDANLKTLSKTVYGIQYAKPTDQNKATPSQAKAPAAPAAPVKVGGITIGNPSGNAAPVPVPPKPVTTTGGITIGNPSGTPPQSKKEKSESEEEKIKKCKDCGLNKITVQEKNNISKFLMHLSEKNYSSAHKYLKAIVNSKINKIVSERIDKI